MPLRYDSFLRRAPSAGGGGGGDPFWNNVVLLASFDGSDGSTSFSDESPSAHGAFTFNGNAQLDDAQKPFAEYATSLLLDGAGDQVRLGDHADWTMPAEFTVEAWLRLSSTSGFPRVVIGQHDGIPDIAWFLLVDFSGSNFRMVVSTDGLNVIEARVTGMSWQTGVWYHLAGTRDSGDTLRAFVDGTVGSQTNSVSGMHASSALLGIGGNTTDDTNDIAGWIGETRVTKGVCRYTGSFTRPSAPFPRLAA